MNLCLSYTQRMTSTVVCDFFSQVLDGDESAQNDIKKAIDTYGFMGIMNIADSILYDRKDELLEYCVNTYMDSNSANRPTAEYVIGCENVSSKETFVIAKERNRDTKILSCLLQNGKDFLKRYSSSKNAIRDFYAKVNIGWRVLNREELIDINIVQLDDDTITDHTKIQT